MTHRILLADDSATIRKVVELTFSDEDFAIDSVGDGAQAFEHARAPRPDIIISDVIMPGLNGYELCQRFKTDPDLQSVPFLFLKGTFESFDEEKARSCGADGFIVKPFESQEMIAKVKELIGRAADRSPPPCRRRLPWRSGLAAVQESRRFRQRPSARIRLRQGPCCSNDRQQRRRRFRRSQTHPAPAPPALPSMPSRPAPPIPQWPTRPVPAMPPSAPPPLQPTPPIHQPPPPATSAADVPTVRPPPPPPPEAATGSRAGCPSTTSVSTSARRRTIVLVRSPPNRRFTREPHLRWSLRGRAMKTSGAR